MPLSLPLSLAILFGPAEPPEHLRHVSEVLQALALHLEVLDERETRYVLIRPEDFVADVKLLRRRWASLKDAPPLHDCTIFPDRALMNDLLAFNRAYRQHLEARKACVGALEAFELGEAIQEADALYQVWDAARDAQCSYYYVTVRREALKRLREQIGEASYHRGVLPPPVPLWRFRRIEP